MRHQSTLLALSALLTSFTGCSTPGIDSEPIGESQIRRPVSTYSIVARDAETGEMGVAVQSHWFSVGSVVPWAEAGVGAVDTQSLVDPSYGLLGLAHMRAGRSAPNALSSLVAGDDGREVRQVAMIDAKGNVDAFTGDNCIADAGHIVDQSEQFSVQANLMANDNVWPAMADAYRNTNGELVDRMLAALQAAQDTGGDIRGKQSAALLIVNAERTGKPWIDRKFDLRIEDHPEPIKELNRLVRLQRAYHHMNAGDVAIEHEHFHKAAKEYAAAEKLAPEIVEVSFWRAVTLVSSDKVEKALPVFRRVFEREPVWAEVVPRLVKSGLLPDDDELIERIQQQAP